MQPITRKQEQKCIYAELRIKLFLSLKHLKELDKNSKRAFAHDYEKVREEISRYRCEDIVEQSYNAALQSEKILIFCGRGRMS